MPSSRAISSASSWRATAFVLVVGAGPREQRVRVVARCPRVLGAVAGAITEREPVCEVSQRSVDLAEGGGEQPEQTIDGQRDEEARGAPSAARVRRTAPSRRWHRSAARRSAPVRSLHTSPGRERAEAARARARRPPRPTSKPLVGARDATYERDHGGEEDVVRDRPRRRHALGHLLQPRDVRRACVVIAELVLEHRTRAQGGGDPAAPQPDRARSSRARLASRPRRGTAARC